ncbi:hypothetical protein ACFLS9_07465 [Bacteroidota bacterium]
MRFRNIAHIVFFTLINTAISLHSQNGTSLIREDAIHVFVDCHRCDQNYIREEIQFVNFVLDRSDADVHVLYTSQRTGGDGREYTLTFIGQTEFEGINDTLIYVKDRTDTDDIDRQKMVQILKLGLIKYVAQTPVAANIKISYLKPEDKEEVTLDPWNYWVFRTSFDSYFDIEESQDRINIRGSVSASRVTEIWKLGLYLNGSYNENYYDFVDTNYTDISRSQRFRSHAIYSISDNWSIGAWLNASSSTYSNIDFNAQFAPGIEYNFFPYSESTRRQLRVQYVIWTKYNNYNQETIYFKSEETLLQESLSTTLDLIEPWGNISVTLQGSHYFHDFNLNSVDLFSRVSWNILKGLTVDLHLGARVIHDQISLPKSDASVADVLLRRRELETQFNYWGSFGFSYYFGSIYNNIVNSRFGD